MPGVLGDARLEAQLAALHARSKAQDGLISDYFRNRRGEWHRMEDRDHAMFADKLVALDQDKAEFCYAVCRAIGAKRIVEAGTSFGVSTLYLAAAVRDNGGGVVIGAEYEPDKVKAARANFAEAGLAGFIELHEGDIVETMRSATGPIDFVLFDIWGDVVRPTLDLLLPLLRQGAVIVADNTAGRPEGYRSFFEVIDDPRHGFRTMTLPFAGGLEMSLKLG